MSDLQWLYDQRLQPLEERNDVTFDLLHESMWKAHWDYFDTLTQQEALKLKAKHSKERKNFYRKLLGMNEDFLASCGLTFEQFYTKVVAALEKRPEAGGILLDPSCNKILLVQCAMSGKYNFLKGRLDPGDNVHDVARDRIKDRIGYSAVLDETPPIEIPNKGRPLTLFYVRDVPLDVKFSPPPNFDKVVSDAKFFDLNQINNNETRKVVAEIVTKCLPSIKSYCRQVKPASSRTR